MMKEDDDGFEHHPDCPLYRESKEDGPAKVNSEAYRRGWETIFGKKQPVGEA